MVTISRKLTLAEYRAANQLLLREGALRHQFNFWLMLRIFPALGASIVGIVLLAFATDTTIDRHVVMILLVCAVVMLLQPWFLQLKLKKLYCPQRLDRLWTIRSF